MRVLGLFLVAVSLGAQAGDTLLREAFPASPALQAQLAASSPDLRVTPLAQGGNGNGNNGNGGPEAAPEPEELAAIGMFLLAVHFALRARGVRRHL